MRAKSDRFDVTGFHKLLDAARQARQMNWKQVAAETRVGPSTLTRIAQGKAPDAVALTALARWANINPTVFLTDAAPPGTETSLGEVLGRLRADQSIPDEIKGVIEAMIVGAMARSNSSNRGKPNVFQAEIVRAASRLPK